MSYVMTSITSIPGIKEIRSHSCIIPISSLSRPNAELCIIMSSMIFGIRRGQIVDADLMTSEVDNQDVENVRLYYYVVE